MYILALGRFAAQKNLVAPYRLIRARAPLIHSSRASSVRMLRSLPC
ncbi:MAG: hypothetical protein JWM61_213 [Micrococcaceae bacterium]|jgi:hypothetical protein|nr:hypothetical protein [Micrococcaceae bacterium]